MRMLKGPNEKFDIVKVWDRQGFEIADVECNSRSKENKKDPEHPFVGIGK